MAIPPVTLAALYIQNGQKRQGRLEGGQNMVSRRNYITITIMILILLFMFQFIGVMKEIGRAHV